MAIRVGSSRHIVKRRPEARTLGANLYYISVGDTLSHLGKIALASTRR